MSRAFLILTTRPPQPVDDPSELAAIVVARHDEAAGLRPGGAASSPTVQPGAAEPGPHLGWVDRLGRTHVWPGLLRERRAR